MEKKNLVANHIQKTYHHKKKVVLSDISFSFSAGQCIGILGANGCGKSTLLSILAGVVRPDAGELRWNEMPLWNRKDTSQIIGYVPQENPLIEELSALDNLRLWYSGGRKEIEQEMNSGTLGRLGIQDFISMKVKHLSGGMKKRLSIGCSVAKNPDILLLDEPGAALDLVCKEQIQSYLKELRSSGKLILLATHEESEIALCDTCYILKNGVLVEQPYNQNIQQIVQAL